MTNRLLCFLVLVLGIFACNDLGTGSGVQRIPPRPLSTGEKNLVVAGNSFCFGLLNAINRNEPSRNVFISPLSVSVALGMTLNGANGATRDAMAQTLGFGAMSQSDINASYRSLITLLTGLDPAVKFQIANSIWYRPDLNVSQAFKDVERVNFNAEINSLNFKSTGAAGTINDWVNRSTNGKITEIITPPIPDSMVMYLVNAIYFKGSWSTRFDPNFTRDDSVTVPSGGRKPCTMMYQRGKLSCFANDQLQAVDLPYGDVGFSMTILLPASGTDIDAFTNSLTQEQWNSIVGDLLSHEGEIYLPKFKLEFGETLNEMLKSMGMAVAFSPAMADFTNIDPHGGLFISEVKHKTFVQVDEEGTEAAAVTSVGIGATAIGANFVMRVDRPFVFAIREKTSGTILFIGKIVEPKF